MPMDDDTKYFFIHVMKTGGTSFADIIAANFPANNRYPDAYLTPDLNIFERFETYLYVPGFVSRVNALQGRLRIVSGHVPYGVRSLLNDSYIAMTLLRDPVERTLSYLKHCRKYHIEHMNLTLEQIYDDPWFHASFIQNYQTKIFSMSPQESLAEDRYLPGAVKLPTRQEMGDGQNLSEDVELLRISAPGRVSMECFAASTGVIKVDEQRLQTAKDNLASVEVVGVTEHLDFFLKQLVDRHGWKIKSIPHRHAGEREQISKEFQRRIAVDNAFDIELYEYAKALTSSI
jgi:Sulfotransferase family